MLSQNATLPVCLVCNSPLTGARQKKYCSLKCKNTNQPNVAYFYQKKRATTRKQHLIDSKGGKCEMCGYNKCIRALTFHHLDPSIKELRMDARHLAGTSWERVLEEAEKCQLLCYNCHMEVHEQWEINKQA